MISVAGKPRHVQLTRVCVENRCVSTPHLQEKATRSHVPWTAQVFFSSPKQQPPRSNEHSRIRSVSPHPHEANEQIRRFIWGEGNVRAARPTKHTKFKTNKLTTVSQDQSQKPQD